MKITDMTARAFWKGEFGITGIVEDGGQQYKVRLEVRDSHVNVYSCSCREGNSYKGMCSHCKALFAYYEEQASQENKKNVSTSQEVRLMIREYTNREVADILLEEEETKVSIVPKLMIRSKEVKLEFRIGRDRLYIIKDLVAFSNAVRQGALAEYGKNLSFHHRMDVFEEESRSLAGFILEIIGMYQEFYRHFRKSTFAAAPGIREINLNQVNRDRFFSEMLGKKLEIEDNQGMKRTVKISDENPTLTITVEKSGKNGIKVSMDQDIFSISGEQYLYILHRDKIYRCSREYSQILKVFMEYLVHAYGSNYKVEVNDKDIPLFYERVLRKIEPYVIIQAKDINLETYRPKELHAKFEFDSLNMGEISMCPTLSYGDYSFHPIEDEKVPRTICRDVPGEYRISQLIHRYFKYREGETGNLVIQDDEDNMYQLLTRGLEEFASLGEIYLSEAFRQIQVLPAPKVSIGVNTSGNWLELNLDLGDMTGQELYQVLSEYTQKKKFYRLKSGEFLKLEDSGLMTVARLVKGLGVSGDDLQNKRFSLPKYRAFYLDSILKESKGVNFFRDNLFKAVVRGIKSVEDSDYQIPVSLKEVLREYQKVGFRWLKTLHSYGFGGILADDMGLGKTIQVIALLLDAAIGIQNKPSLIVCPASLVYNWENELHSFAPQLRVLTVAGSAKEREEQLGQIEDYNVVVTSYDLLKRDISVYQHKSFQYQIIDEAQYIKNAQTQSAKAVKAIEADARFALTGTPIENRLSELWSIFDYLMPGFLFSYQKFKKEWELPIVRDQDKDVLSMLHRMIGPFILRRLKQDVLKELPDKLETVVYSKFEQTQKELYLANALRLKQQLQDEGPRHPSDTIQILTELTRLRQICCDPSLYYENYQGGSAKLETCIDLIINGVEGGHKILLFSQFTSMLDIIGRRLEKEGVEFYILTGATSKEERLRRVNSFQKDQIPVFLISLKAGGTGLNLTAADIVIHYDPWWNVAAQNQATDRTHRIGQEKQVSVFKLITKDTIEENILKLQEAKKSLAEQIITEGTISLSSLTREDLLEILSGSEL